VRYLLLMKSYGFKISYLDVTNEWQADFGGRVTQHDVRDVSEYLNETYLANPWPHPDLDSNLLLTADDIPQIVAPSSWNYDEGRRWIDGLNSSRERNAIQVEEYCNPGTEIWNTEVHGWKSTSNADEVLTSAFMFEAINAGFHGLSGWLAIGTTNQGHSYILNPSGSPSRNVKYYMFEKLTNTSHRGYALEVNEPDEFEADSLDADASVSALIRGNVMSVWVLNHSDTEHSVAITPKGRKISDYPINSTRWSEVAGLPDEGVTESIGKNSDEICIVTVEAKSVYCFEILLEPEDFPYKRIQAEAYDSSSVVPYGTENTGDVDGDLNLSNMNDGTWTSYQGIDLTYAKTIRLRVAAPAGRPDGVIEVRIGSDTGTVIGRTAVPVTGHWQSYQTIETTLDPVSGVHDVYLKYVEAGSNTTGSGAMFNLNWFEIEQAEPPINPVATAVSGSQITVSWDAVNGAVGYTVKRSTSPGGPYVVLDNTVTGTSYIDNGVSAGVRYYYVVATRYATIDSGDSVEVSAVPSNPIVIGDVVVGPLVFNAAGNSVSLSILNSGLGHLHQWQKSEDLSNGSWVDVGIPVPGNGGVLNTSYPVDPTEDRYFYRVKIWRE